MPLKPAEPLMDAPFIIVENKPTFPGCESIEVKADIKQPTNEQTLNYFLDKRQRQLCSVKREPICRLRVRG